MTPNELIESCLQKGILFTTEGTELAVTRSSRLSDEEVLFIRENKESILPVLQKKALDKFRENGYLLDKGLSTIAILSLAAQCLPQGELYFDRGTWGVRCLGTTDTDMVGLIRYFLDKLNAKEN